MYLFERRDVARWPYWQSVVDPYHYKTPLSWHVYYGSLTSFQTRYRAHLKLVIVLPLLGGGGGEDLATFRLMIKSISRWWEWECLYEADEARGERERVGLGAWGDGGDGPLGDEYDEYDEYSMIIYHPSIIRPPIIIIFHPQQSHRLSHPPKEKKSISLLSSSESVPPSVHPSIETSASPSALDAFSKTILTWCYSALILLLRHFHHLEKNLFKKELSRQLLHLPYYSHHHRFHTLHPTITITTQSHSFFICHITSAHSKHHPGILPGITLHSTFWGGSTLVVLCWGGDYCLWKIQSH